MTKKQTQHVKVSISGDSEHCYTAIYKHIELKPAALRFLHLERKGNTWLVLDALDCFEEGWEIFTIPYHRSEVEGGTPLPQLDLVGKRVDIRAYTVLHLPGQAFYHLDELPDGTWRITHSDGLLHCNHDSIHHLTVRKV